MKLLFSLLLIIGLHHLATAQMDNTQDFSVFEKGTYPKSIKIKRLSPKSRKKNDCEFFESFYFNSKEKLDSSITKNCYFKKIYTYNDTSYTIDRYNIIDGKYLKVNTSRFDLSGFKEWEYEIIAPNKEYEMHKEKKFIKNTNGDIHFAFITTKQLNKKYPTAEVVEYFYNEKFNENKVLSYRSQNPIDSTFKESLSVENRHQFVPRVTRETEYEYRNDTTFLTHYKKGEIFLIEWCYEKEDYKACEAEYVSNHSDFKMVEGQIQSKDTLINYTVSFKYKDSKFVETHLIHNSKHNNGYEIYSYNYATDTYGNEKSAIYRFINDEKNNWIDCTIEKENGEVEIISREIIY